MNQKRGENENKNKFNPAGFGSKQTKLLLLLSVNRVFLGFVDFGNFSLVCLFVCLLHCDFIQTNRQTNKQTNKPKQNKTKKNKNSGKPTGYHHHHHWMLTSNFLSPTSSFKVDLEKKISIFNFIRIILLENHSKKTKESILIENLGLSRNLSMFFLLLSLPNNIIDKQTLHTLLLCCCRHLTINK